MPKLKGRLKSNLKKSEIYRIVIFMLASIFIISIAYLVYLKSNNTISSDISISEIFTRMFSFSLNKDIKIKTIEFNTKDLKSFDVNDDYMYKVTKENIEIYDKSGRMVNNIDIKMNNPVVRAAGKYAVVANLDSSEIIYIHKDKIVKDIKTEHNILNFSLNNSGYVVYLDEAKEYRTAVNVLDSKGNEVFHKGKGEKFIVEAKIFPNSSYVAMSVIDTAGVYANTDIEFLDATVNFGKIISSTSKNDTIYSTILPFNDGIVVVGSSELAYYSKYSALKWKKNFNGRIQSTCKLNEDEIAVSANNSNNNIMDTNESEISVFNVNGERKAKYKVSGRVKNIKSLNNMILTYTSRDIYINDSDGNVIWKKNLSRDILDAYYLYEDRIAIVDRDKFEIIKINN